MHAAGQEYMPHHCVPCGVQSINNESKINPSLMAGSLLCTQGQVRYCQVLFTLRHGLNRSSCNAFHFSGKNA